VIAEPVVLALTEDTSRDSPHVIARVAEALLSHVTQGFKPLFQEPSPLERTAMGGNRWFGDEPQRRRLVRAIATHISVGGFVVLHVDGDVTWPGRSKKRPRSPNDDHIDRLVRQVGRALSGGSTARLLQLRPFWSIESWLYLNDEAIAGLDDPGFRRWIIDNRDTRRGFDAVRTPKTVCPAGDQHNRELAQGFPLDAARLRSPSLQLALDDWEASVRSYR
jgi:hypothetical protein